MRSFRLERKINSGWDWGLNNSHTLTNHLALSCLVILSYRGWRVAWVIVWCGTAMGNFIAGGMQLMEN